MCEALRGAQISARCTGSEYLHIKWEVAVDLIRLNLIFNAGLFHDEHGKIFYNQEISSGVDTRKPGRSGEDTDEGKADNPLRDDAVSFDGFF